MADAAAPSRFFFLYRQAEGVIDAGVWARSAWKPVVIALAVILPWAVFRPSLTDAELSARSQMAAFGYYAAYLAGLMISVVVTLFAIVAEYCVSAKRFRDCGWSPRWAGLAPIVIALALATHWIAARDPEAGAGWLALAMDALAAMIVIWTAVTLMRNASKVS